MRVEVRKDGFAVRAIAGTRTVLLAFNCDEATAETLMGFAVGRRQPDGKVRWLRSLKVFRSVVPDPDPRTRYTTRAHPVQSFLWGDYTAEPDTSYTYVVWPLKGRPGALAPMAKLQLELRTEAEFDGRHGIWFNRGAIASQAFEREFGNQPPQDPDDPEDETTKWLSRGLLEACLQFVDETREGEGLRVAAYEFTYPPILQALKYALERGVDVKIAYHSEPSGDGQNDRCIEEIGLPARWQRRQVLYRRTKPEIPHNKFIIRLTAQKKPCAVWTGSTNFTPSGFLGQSNVGHLVVDADVARRYLKYWDLIRRDPDRNVARTTSTTLTPDPPELLPPNSVTPIFSPRPDATMLAWYSRRIAAATLGVMLTAAFGVTKELRPALAGDKDFLRFVLMEKPPTDAARAELEKDPDVRISYGAVLGEMYTFKNGKPTARRRIKDFALERWLLSEDHYRRAGDGFVFFVHTKFLLVDPLSADPLVCTGSANFSPGSLKENDENMLLIRGDTRVADIYLTEYDRLFRHFYFRDVANEIEAAGRDAAKPFLSEEPGWATDHFHSGWYRSRRREMFFAHGTGGWAS